MLYHYITFPRGLIGPADLLWRPIDPSESHEPRQMWLRIHPSIFEETWQAIKTAISQLVLDRRSQPGPSSMCDEVAIQMRDLRSEVEAFEIMGPRAGLVLRRVLRVCRGESAAKLEVSLV